ncbi:MAG: 4-(cytidine 5'-diphospho)-2-C-methyl-D-erythritol kinase, partial [Lachnospiraceae bacterium]|nr:4-(cytidine 5'-diphospho)-2-C-methyl-D-erythritol kinase [Lachnospiraceae bacterium]
MDSMKVKALAKVNLGLDVLGRREDGYHEIRMIMQTIHLYDQLEITRTVDPGISIETNLDFLPVNENNLVYKAAKLMKDTYGIHEGVHVVLNKHIPVAAGLAGGSTDAAAVMYGMNELFRLREKRQKLMELGIKIGADVPYCLMRGTALAEGIGEKLKSLPPAPKCPVLIAKPGISVSTKFVYEHLKLDEHTRHPDIDAQLRAIYAKDLRALAG